jgi:predicted dehydrogenase
VAGSSRTAQPFRLGLVGYGTGGQHFHAPFIDAAEGIELVGVVTRSPERRTLVAREWPGVAAYSSLAELLAAGVDAVTITTPPATRRGLVLEAVAAGVHVVADKPFAPTAVVGAELATTAEQAGVLLSVFHNRRWDADVRTLADVLASGDLGELWRVHSRFDLDDPATLEAGPDGGLLRDIGSHVVDQMVWLLGPVSSVSAHLDYVELPQGRTDAGFVLQLQHISGVLSVVESSKLNRLSVRELRAYGSRGSYRWVGSDVQAQAIFAGLRPGDDLDGWGYDESCGLLATHQGEREVASSQGRYHDFYSRFAAAVRGDVPLPVSAAEGVTTLAVLDAARASAETGRTAEVIP